MRDRSCFGVVCRMGCSHPAIKRYHPETFRKLTAERKFAPESRGCFPSVRRASEFGYRYPCSCASLTRAAPATTVHSPDATHSRALNVATHPPNIRAVRACGTRRRGRLIGLGAR
jgi:hypothetical protein